MSLSLDKNYSHDFSPYWKELVALREEIAHFNVIGARIGKRLNGTNSTNER